MEETRRKTQHRLPRKYAKWTLCVQSRSFYLVQWDWNKWHLLQIEELLFELTDSTDIFQYIQVEESLRVYYCLETFSCDKDFQESLCEVALDVGIDFWMQNFQDLNVESTSFIVG